ncbi:Uncharacterized protein TCM_019688 [Theobroma cacao]|uniref:Uncharacterized protein n=1 Tax=Theobroma cacao TaxID=3641 RepID=A0A061EJ40_THECC|nr:Uncharacterized protein TCM_019688 [Theobroma cacao]
MFNRTNHPSSCLSFLDLAAIQSEMFCMTIYFAFVFLHVWSSTVKGKPNCIIPVFEAMFGLIHVLKFKKKDFNASISFFTSLNTH